MKNAFLLSVLLLGTVAFSFAGCKKGKDDPTSVNSKAPRTNPMPAELQGQWLMTSSGAGYVYDGWRYGNSGHGIETTVKADGTGWWNDVDIQATPGCVLSMNLSLDNTFEVRKEAGLDMLFVYIVSGEYHGKGCTTQTDKILTAEQTYPAYPPFKYYYKIAAADNNPSQKLLVLSQEADPAKRFRAGVDKTMSALKKN